MPEEEKEKLEKEIDKEVKQTVKAKTKTQKEITKKENDIKSHLGEIKIAPEVLAMIVNRTVIGVAGVAGLVAHSKSGFGTLLGAKEEERGIKIDLIDEKNISAHVSVIIEYGFTILDVAKDIQQRVKREIENKAGLMVKLVDVSIMGIQTNKA